jgi:hypothetical protein
MSLLAPIKGLQVDLLPISEVKVTTRVKQVVFFGSLSSSPVACTLPNVSISLH